MNRDQLRTRIPPPSGSFASVELEDISAGQGNAMSLQPFRGCGNINNGTNSKLSKKKKKKVPGKNVELVIFVLN